MEGAGYVGVGEPRTHVWVIDAAAGAEPRQVTDGPFDDLDATWSPDGRSIAFASDRSPDADRHFGGEAIHVVDVAPAASCAASRPRAALRQLPSWSPGGERIAYLRSESPHRLDGHHNRLWVVDVATGRGDLLDRGPRPQRRHAARRLHHSVSARRGRRTAARSSTSSPTRAPRSSSRITPAGVEWLTRDQAVVEEVSASAAGDRAIVAPDRRAHAVRALVVGGGQPARAASPASTTRSSRDSFGCPIAAR